MDLYETTGLVELRLHQTFVKTDVLFVDVYEDMWFKNEPFLVKLSLTLCESSPSEKHVSCKMRNGPSH